jgi:hypothetical protein
MDQKIDLNQYYIYLDQGYWVVGAFKAKYVPNLVPKDAEFFKWREEASLECHKRNKEKAIDEGWIDNQVPWVKSHKFTYRDYYDRWTNA